ncbi:MAG: T9SS type A sorting domain-containing protein [Chitinophagales bacterium]|nr:T9SS type A sorting domain-containing protein [Chitinophagaceae bacterium]MCB9066153.1 T9SS type A sorting domain-containing protein [Chitinophagales bacterium]
MRYLLLIALLLCSTIADAQLTEKIIEINADTNVGSSLGNFTAFKNKVYFYANDSVHGVELWVTDGNSASIVVDIWPGYQHGTFGGYGFKRICVVKDTLYFAGRYPNVTDKVIYKYDGQNTPTVAIDLSSFSGYAYEFVEVNGLMYFVAEYQNSKIGLFEYTPSTGIVKQLTYDTSTYKTYGYSKLANFNNKLYFAGIGPGNTGPELHEYNPQSQTFNTISEIVKGPDGIGGFNTIEVYNNRLYFSANLTNSNSYLHLFEYDGTNPPIEFSNGSNIPVRFAWPNLAKKCYTFLYNKIYISGYDTITKKSDLYQYDPSNKSFYRIGEDSISATYDLLTYNQKIYHYHSQKVRINELNGPSYSLSSVNPTITFSPSIANRYGYIIHDGKLITVSSSANNQELLILYDSTLSINDTKNQATLSVTAYPNPTEGDVQLDITLKTSQAFSVLLTDINGRIVYRKEAQLYSSGKHTIDIPTNNLPAATYIYSIQDNAGTILNSGRLLKQ